MVQPIPEGIHTVTPYLRVRGAAKAIAFYEKAFGAVQKMAMPGPGDSLMHAEIRIGDSAIYLADTFPPHKSPLELKGSGVTIHLSVADCDVWWDRAVKAGCTVRMPIADQFWGDRYGQLQDPFGHVWGISTQKEDVPPEEMGVRAQKAMAEFAAMAAKPKPKGRSTKKKPVARQAAKPSRKAARKTTAKAKAAPRPKARGRQ